jgi:hypothetical protein
MSFALRGIHAFLSIRHRAGHRRRRPLRARGGHAPECRHRIESLERRIAAAAIGPSAEAQLFLEEVNDIRQQRRLGPLAFDERLQSLAPRLEQVGFGSGGVTRVKRLMTQAGVPWNSRDSVVFGVSPAFPEGHPLTRANPGFKPSHARHRIVGLAPVGSRSIFDVTASRAGNLPIITGVIYRDTNGNGAYDFDEGLGNVRVEARAGSIRASRQVWSTGGFSLPINTRRIVQMTVTVTGGDLDAPITQTVRVRPGANSRLNFVVPVVEDGGPTPASLPVSSLPSPPVSG